jgi:putative endonuclease
MDFYAYLLRCSDGSYYSGHTDDIDLRIAQHQTGALGGYTAKRRPVELVWCDRFPTRDEAFAVERKLKGWSRAKKEALIAGDWDRIQVLARNREESAAGVRKRPSTSSGRAEVGNDAAAFLDRMREAGSSDADAIAEVEAAIEEHRASTKPRS